MIKILKILSVALFINLFMLTSLFAQTAEEQRFMGTLITSQAIKIGEFMCSANNKFALDLEEGDGELSFHEANQGASTNINDWGDKFWENNKRNYGQNKETRLEMYTDGNLYIFRDGYIYAWKAEDSRLPVAGSRLQIEDTGYLSIYSPTHSLLWRVGVDKNPQYTLKRCEILKKFIPQKQSLCDAGKISEVSSSFRQCLDSCNNDTSCKGFISFMGMEDYTYTCGIKVCSGTREARRCSKYKSTCNSGSDGYVIYNPDPPPAPPKYDPPTKGDCEGGDMTGGSLGKKTFDECTTECNNKTGCVAFSFNYWANDLSYGKCNLKQEIKEPFNSTSHYQCYTKPPMYDPPIDGSCVNIDNIISVEDASSGGVCGAKCNQDTSCHGYQYKEVSTTKNCILVGANSTAPSACIINPDCTGWKWYKKIISNLTLTPSKDYSYINVPCGYKVSKVGESCYTSSQGFAGVQLSIKSLQACASSCTGDNSCNGFSYNQYSICRFARSNSCVGSIVADMTCPNGNIDLYRNPGVEVRVKDTSTFYSKINAKLNYEDGYGRSYEAFTEGDCAFDSSLPGSLKTASNLISCRDFCSTNNNCKGFSFSAFAFSDNCKLDLVSSDKCNTRIHNGFQYYWKNTQGCGDGLISNGEECDLGWNMFGQTNNKDVGGFGCSVSCKNKNVTTEVKYWDCSNDQTKTTEWKTSKLEGNYNYLLVNQDQSIIDVNNSKDYKEKFIEFVSINKTIPLDCSKAGPFVPNKFRYGNWFSNLGWTLNDTMIMYSPPSTTSVSTSRKNRLDEGEYLLPGQFICSQNKKFKLTFQTAGNLCLNKAGANNAMDHVWCLYNTLEEINANFNTQPTAFSGVVMQADCNLVMYKNVLLGKGHIFDTGTNGHLGCYMILQNDSKLIIYDKDHNNIKQVNTAEGSTNSTFTDC